MDLILAFSTDIIDRGYEIDSSLSPILYKTEGVVGHRVFTLEFRNAGFNGGDNNNGIYTDYINFQLKIYEENSNISVHIGPYFTSNPGLDFEGFSGPSIGLIQGYDFVNDTILGEIFILAGNPLNPDIINDLTPLNLQWPIPEMTLYTFYRNPADIVKVEPPTFINYFYPNPTSGKLFLSPEMLKNIISPIKIFDSIGILVRTDYDLEVLDLNNLSTGFYELYFQTNLGNVIQRISIMR
jgi:hypothetical protein